MAGDCSVWALLVASFLHLGLSQRVDHGHVNVEIMGFFKALAAYQAGKLQVSLCLVFSHVIFQRRPLTALEATDLASARKHLINEILVLLKMIKSFIDAYNSRIAATNESHKIKTPRNT